MVLKLPIFNLKGLRLIITFTIVEDFNTDTKIWFQLVFFINTENSIF